MHKADWSTLVTDPVHKATREAMSITVWIHATTMKFAVVDAGPSLAHMASGHTPERHAI